MTSRNLGHRAPLLWLVLPLIAGLSLGKSGAPAPVAWLLGGAFVAALLALVAAWRAPRWWAVPLCIAMVLAGDASYVLHRARLAAWEQLPRREAQLSLRVDRVFPQTDPKKTSGLAIVARAGEPLRDIAGQRIYFSLALRKGESPPVRSAVLSAIGVLETVPRNPPADSFEAYLANAGVNFRLTRGRLLATLQPPARYYAWLNRCAARLNAILSEGVAKKRPELTAAFRAMMLGQKHELTEEQDLLFMHSGTMHLFAINGLHIGVVAVALHALLAALRCPRAGAALLTLAVLWLDVDTTGASPSAVRAFLLVAAFEAAFVLRLPASGLSALTTAALAVVMVEPLALFSASFQMSYGVVLAILCLGLPLGEWLEKRGRLFRDIPAVTWAWWQRGLAFGWRGLSVSLGVGLAAALVGAVTSAEFYQTITPGGLLANLVLAPLATVVIVAGFSSVAVGMMGLNLGSSLFNHAAVLVLWGIDALIRLGVRIPGMWWTAHWRTDWGAPATYAILLAVILAGYGAGWRRERGGFWPPFAIVALGLISGVKFG